MCRDSGSSAPLGALLGVLFSHELLGWFSLCCMPPEGVPLPFWGADTPNPSCAALPIPAPLVAVTLKLPSLPPSATFPSQAVHLPLSHQEPVSRCDWEPAGRSLGVCFASPTRSRAGGDRGLAASCLDRQHPPCAPSSCAEGRGRLHGAGHIFNPLPFSAGARWSSGNVPKGEAFGWGTPKGSR